MSKDTQISELVNAIKAVVLLKRPENAMQLIVVAMQAAETFGSLSGKEKKLLVVDVLTEIAKGSDGVEGTSDDLISPTIMKSIRAMIENDLLTSTIDIIIDATKGRLDINKATTCVASFVACLHKVFFPKYT